MARKKKEIEEDYINGETRGAYLMRSLNLKMTDYVEREIVYKPKKSTLNISYGNKEYIFLREDFIIKQKNDERFGLCYAVKHKTWSDDAFIYGGETKIEALKFIDYYMEENKKPLMERSINFIKLIHEKN